MFDAYRNGARELDALPSKLTDDERRALKKRIADLTHSIGMLQYQIDGRHLEDVISQQARKSLKVFARQLLDDLERIDA